MSEAAPTRYRITLYEIKKTIPATKIQNTNSPTSERILIKTYRAAITKMIVKKAENKPKRTLISIIF